MSLRPLHTVSVREDDDLQTIEVPAIADLNGFLCEARVHQEVSALADAFSHGDRTVDPTRTVVLTGPRGCGKTTAMNYLVSRIAPGTSEAIYANSLVYRAGRFARVVVEAIAAAGVGPSVGQDYWVQPGGCAARPFLFYQAGNR